jgi:hypothetical protein
MVLEFVILAVGVMVGFSAGVVLFGWDKLSADVAATETEIDDKVMVAAVSKLVDRGLVKPSVLDKVNAALAKPKDQEV